MIIQSFDRFGEQAVFDPDEGTITVERGSDSAAATTPLGHYTSLADTPVVLYRAPTSLRLRVGRTEVPVDDTVSVTHRTKGATHILEVTDRTAERPAVHLEYTLPKPIVAPEDDPTPFAEPEDFDFGLFVASVASDVRRREAIYR